MITVIVQSLLDVSKILGGREVPLTVPKDCTVGQLLDIIIEKWGDDIARYIYEPETGELVSYMKFMVNGRSVNLLDKLDTVLHDNDFFLIFPPVGGG